jgi:NADPH:quinone reductase-like Zn-dependent oxidoreductase
MRAMAIVGAFGLDHFKLVERPIPQPRYNEVVIRIAAVSLNYRDMDMVLGTYPFKFPLPLVPTSDGVGQVVAVGEGVTRAKVGDRVLGTFHQSWIAGRYEEDTPQLGGSADGMLAERSPRPARHRSRALESDRRRSRHLAVRRFNFLALAGDRESH